MVMLVYQRVWEENLSIIGLVEGKIYRKPWFLDCFYHQIWGLPVEENDTGRDHSML